MTFAPPDGRGQRAGQTHVVYGVELGVTRTTRADLSGAFDEMVQALKSLEPTLRSVSITRLIRIAGRQGLRGTFSKTSTVTGGPEFTVVAAAPVERGRTLYVVGLAPSDQWEVFRPTLEAILSSIEKLP